ncbi:uracil-DNA glycosylase [Ruminococcus sp. OA3]|uniref:uracil-DNA glycosylase n=1 Tax=Ruminococcus sp. OA3 TaxID=2914164 RepID=UPI001F05911D|nr:uracil-DNA glycosylase [Ruminococcus sp. OA3]MCH1981194.1 uracil-DNA glycosylase [Ruminococcus sp. OA3]
MYTWEELNTFVNFCCRCGLSHSRIRPVMGRGNLQADLMFIAEAPGAEEDRAGIPFIGPAGQLFDQPLGDCGISREDIYITNILKCHPPRNRDPQDSEKESCIPYLKYEILLIRPRIIVCLGRVAAQRILSIDYRITKQHGQWIHRKNYDLTAVYHPSAILRDPGKREETRQDFLSIAEKLRNCRQQ